MPTAQVTFKKLIQDSQDYGSNDQHMVSRAFFSLEYEGAKYDNLHVDIKQTVGSDFESSPLEVSRPHGYSGPFNYQEFQRAAEGYYRAAMRTIGVKTGSTIRMRNNTFGKSLQVEFEVSKQGAAW
jgi:hypothetical protein